MDILNIAAGKMPYLKDMDYDKEGNFVVNLDLNYYNNAPLAGVETSYINRPEGPNGDIYYCNEDVFKFLERTIMNFDLITIYRFLEHVSFTQVLYFIYLVSTAVRIGGLVDVIVPNYQTLGNLLYQDNVDDPKFEEKNILLTTELLNEPSNPHASIWTPPRAPYFWEYEGRFIVRESSIDPHFVYDGRNIYIRFQAERA
jgi:hypothetical protein